MSDDRETDDAVTSSAAPEGVPAPPVEPTGEGGPVAASESTAPVTTQGLALVRHNAFKDLSPGGQMAAAWFRQLARALKTCRLYKRENPVCIQLRDLLYVELLENLETCGAWVFRTTPVEIFLLDEAVVRPPQKNERSDDDLPGKEAMLPFLFYRDGIRGFALLPKMPRHDFDALFNALISAGGGPQTHDDLVTLMWQANATHVQLEAVPVEQTIYLSSRQPTAFKSHSWRKGLSYAWSAAGEEIHADIGQESGIAQGLHKDTFDDWPLPEQYVDVPSGYQALQRGIEFGKMRLSTEWVGERSTDWTTMAPELLRHVRSLDPSPETSGLLAHSVTTWLVSAIQGAAWDEAQRALELVQEFDPGLTRTAEDLTEAIAGLDTDLITEKLDESTTDDQARFFALAVGMGRPALDLACSVMAKAAKSRTRAAACTMLCYLCNDEPQLLERYIHDSRWYVVRNAAFVLGQIGGAAVVEPLTLAAQHPEPRVRRQVVQSLGGVPKAARIPILLAQLDTKDPQLLAAALTMLMRDRHPVAARAILRHIEAPDFESRTEDNQRTLFSALADVATDDVVPALEALLHKGGWFARRTLQRVATARTLARMGTEKSQAALEAGLQSRSEAVRSVCLDAMSARIPL
jgi:hypothetical protein